LVNCFFDIQIDKINEYSYNSNLVYLIERSRVVDEDKLLSEKIVGLDLATESYSRLIYDLQKNKKRNIKNECTAYIIAGNIGSGKSTLIHALCREGFIKNDSRIILEDVYKKIFFDGIKNLEKAYCYAKTFVCEQIKKSINDENSFVLELVPSSDEKIDLIKALKTIGYKIITYYLETDEISINNNRVIKRCSEGADFVSENKVISRNNLTTKYYPYLVSLSDELYLLKSRDNAMLLSHYMENGKIQQITNN
jgi:predicted ABC-type ATPase